MAIKTIGHDIDAWDDESVVLMVDHLCREFGSKDAMFRHARRLPPAERVAKYRHMLAGTLEDLLPSWKYGMPLDTTKPLPLPSEQPLETLEKREDRALTATSDLLSQYSDAKWESLAMRAGKDVEAYRKEIWAKIFMSKRKYG